MLELLESELGIRIIAFFQSGFLGRFFWYLFLPLHYLGSEAGYILIVPPLYWAVNKKLGQRLFVMLMLGTIVSSVFKVWWKRPRPFHVNEELICPLKVTNEYGLPSGHTVFGTIFGSSLFKMYKQNWMKITGVLLIICMGVSRMVHGMHFLQDVMVGWLIGFIIIFLSGKLENSIVIFFKKKKFIEKLVFISGVTGILAFVVMALNSTSDVPKDLFAPLGALSGGIIGLIIEDDKIRFNISNRLKNNILRMVFGLVALMAVYLILDVVYYAWVGNQTAGWVSYIYLIRYLLVGIWITAGIPYLFIKAKWK
jgi:membrane-associated phospholipid phosphatase